MASRDSYLVMGDDIDAIKRELNVHLQYIADRLDRLEGIRGKPTLNAEGLTVTGSVTVNDDEDQKIHGFE